MDLNRLARSSGHEEEQIVEIPRLTIMVRPGPLLPDETLEQAPQRCDRQSWPVELSENDPPRLLRRQGPQAPERLQTPKALIVDSELGGGVGVGHFLEAKAGQWPIEFLPEKLEEILK